MNEFRSDVAGLCAPPEPYSYSVRAGDTLYLAGQVALDEQMQTMREDLVQEQKRTAERVVERTEAVKKGEPIQERGMFGEGSGRGGRQRGDSPEGERPKGEKGDKPKTAG